MKKRVQIINWNDYYRTVEAVIESDYELEALIEEAWGIEALIYETPIQVIVLDECVE